MYDLDADPIERDNLVDRSTGTALYSRHEAERERLDAALHERMHDVGAFMYAR